MEQIREVSFHAKRNLPKVERGGCNSDRQGGQSEEQLLVRSRQSMPDLLSKKIRLANAIPPETHQHHRSKNSMLLNIQLSATMGVSSTMQRINHDKRRSLTGNKIPTHNRKQNVINGNEYIETSEARKIPRRDTKPEYENTLDSLEKVFVQESAIFDHIINTQGGANNARAGDLNSSCRDQESNHDHGLGTYKYNHPHKQQHSSLKAKDGKWHHNRKSMGSVKFERSYEEKPSFNKVDSIHDSETTLLMQQTHSSPFKINEGKLKSTSVIQSRQSPVTRTSKMIGSNVKAANKLSGTPNQITKNNSKTLFDLIEMPLVPWKKQQHDETKVVNLSKDQRRQKEEAERMTFGNHNKVSSQELPRGQKADRIIEIYRKRKEKLVEQQCLIDSKMKDQRRMSAFAVELEQDEKDPSAKQKLINVTESYFQNRGSRSYLQHTQSLPSIEQSTQVFDHQQSLLFGGDSQMIMMRSQKSQLLQKYFKEPTINASELFRHKKSRQPSFEKTSQMTHSKLSKSNSLKRLSDLPARREFRNRLAAAEDKARIDVQEECLRDLKRMSSQAQQLQTLEGKDQSTSRDFLKTLKAKIGSQRSRKRNVFVSQTIEHPRGSMIEMSQGDRQGQSNLTLRELLDTEEMQTDLEDCVNQLRELDLPNKMEQIVVQSKQLKEESQELSAFEDDLELSSRIQYINAQEAVIASLPQQKIWKNLSFKNNNQRRLLGASSHKRMKVEQVDESVSQVIDHQKSVENLRHSTQSSQLLPKLNSAGKSLHLDHLIKIQTIGHLFL